jgi:RNA polymerase sigma factor (sigma-70 family)
MTNALIEQHLPVARSMAYSMHRKSNYAVDIDDLIGEANYSLVKSARLWDGRGEFASFAGQLIRWSLIDYLRQQGPCSRTSARPRIVSLDSVAEPAVRPEATPDFDNMTRPLNKRYRRIFDLHFRQGWTLAEIGDDIGVTHGRVGQIVKRGIEQMRVARRWAA